MHVFRHLIPDAKTLLALSPADLAGYMLEYLLSMPPDDRQTLLDDLADDAELRVEDLTRAQAAKLRVENARALLQFIRGAPPKH
jgi:hypothetical protein